MSTLAFLGGWGEIVDTFTLCFSLATGGLLRAQTLWSDVLSTWASCKKSIMVLILKSSEEGLCLYLHSGCTGRQMGKGHGERGTWGEGGCWDATPFCEVGKCQDLVGASLGHSFWLRWEDRQERLL